MERRKELVVVPAHWSAAAHGIQPGNLHCPAHFSPGQTQLPRVSMAVASSQTTPKNSFQWHMHPTICRQSSPSLGQTTADEPSSPPLHAHPFLWSYPSAKIWSSARIPERPDCADLDLAVLLAVQLQPLEIQQALGVLCPRSFWY